MDWPMEKTLLDMIRLLEGVNEPGQKGADHREMAVLIGSLSWVKEFGTIALRGPRRSGHTYAVRVAAKVLMGMGKFVVTLVGTNIVMRDREVLWEGCGPIAAMGCERPSSRLTSLVVVESKQPDFVFVDDASRLNDVERLDTEQFVARFVTKDHPCYLVLVG